MQRNRKRKRNSSNDVKETIFPRSVPFRSVPLRLLFADGDRSRFVLTPARPGCDRDIISSTRFVTTTNRHPLPRASPSPCILLRGIPLRGIPLRGVPQLGRPARNLFSLCDKRSRSENGSERIKKNSSEENRSPLQKDRRCQKIAAAKRSPLQKIAVAKRSPSRSRNATSQGTVGAGRSLRSAAMRVKSPPKSGRGFLCSNNFKIYAQNMHLKAKNMQEICT